MIDKLENKKQQALEMLVNISEDFIKLSFESINFQRLVDYIIELSDAGYAILNLVDEKDSNLQTTVAFSSGKVSQTELEDILEIPHLIGSTWRVNVEKLRWEYESDDYSFSLPGTSVQPLLRVYDSIHSMLTLPVERVKVIQLEQTLGIGETVLVRLMDEKRLIGNFVLLMEAGRSFTQHYAVRIYARQLSQLLMRRSREKEIKRLLTENDIIFNSTQDMLTLIRKIDYGNYQFIRVNEAFNNLTGIDPKYVIDQSPESVYGPDKAREIIRHYDNCMLADVPVSYDLSVELPNGNKHFQITLNPAHFDQDDYIVSSAKDVTEERSNQERVEYLSFHDQLTGLYNRHYFNHSLRRLDTARNLPLSVIMIDVNGLKLVNDAFGHSLGDQLLHTAGQTITEHSRADDIVCRIGGDEFVFVLPQTDEKGTETVIKRLSEACKGIYLGPFQLSFSIGWATRHDIKMSTRELMHQAEEWMYKHKLIESPVMRNNVIDKIMEILNSMPYERTHAEATARMAVEMACRLGWSERRVRKIRKACLYHDIGKIIVSADILNKESPLDDKELALLRRHSETGYRILASSGDYTDVAEIVLEHHERWDGTGYPRKISGEKLQQASRIIAIAEAYDAMTNELPWQVAKTSDEALQELKDCAGSQFDPSLVKLFIEEKIYKHKSI